MKVVAVRDAKASLSEYIEEAQRDRVLITKHGKPVAKLVPIHTDSAKLIGSFKGKIKIKGNILSTAVKWDAES